MGDEIKLGNLEFTGAEVFRAYRASENLVIPGECDSNDALAIELNRILAEKLEKAPLVYGDTHSEWREDIQMHSLCEELLSHSARLVCIEPIDENIVNS